jgi:hypothetical protein
MHKGMKISLIAILSLALLTPINITSASATPNITATGTNPSACNQTVDVTTGVTAERLANGDCVVKFTAASTTISWTVPTGVTAVNVLVVGGGGGGGSRAAGGGGSGGFAETTNYLVTAGNIQVITVGAGGAGAASSSAANGSQGSASSFLRSAAGLTANGGAGGLDHLSPGFGKGGASGSATGTGAVSSNAGGAQLTGTSCANNWCGGGGAGAGAVGANAVTTGGVGGNGRSSSITGTPITYAGGGGGGSGSNSNTPTPGGAGGSGGGGAGATSAGSPCTSGNGTNGSANLGGGGGAAGYCITPNSQGTGGSGGSGVVIVQYNPDTTPPTFTSSTLFSVAENIATSATAATITVSESATINISGGADSVAFNVYFSDSVTALIKFKVSPNYESPSDSGSNNVYDITLNATDTVGNAGTQSITITVTDVVDTSAFNSFALAGSVTTATYRTTIQITANVTVAAKITFRANNNRIPGCINVRTSGTSPNIVAVCNWKPSRRGPLTLTAAATPTGAGISSASATPIRVLVGNRTGTR